MNKMDKTILSIDNTKIFNGSDFFLGFKRDRVIYNNILKNLEWVRRGDAEVDFTKKQPIAYGVVYNKETDSFFLYKREDNTKGGKNGETRLNNRYSLGLGGHIERKDLRNVKRNVLEDSLLREVKEEIKLNGDIKKVEFLGLINAEETEVDEVHIGVLYLLYTDATEGYPLDGEISFGKFVKKKDIKKEIQKDNGTLETWSQVILDNKKEIDCLKR